MYVWCWSKHQLYFSSISEKKYSSECAYILQTQFMQNMDALCEFGAYKSEGKQVKPRDFLWSIMFSGVLICVRNHPWWYLSPARHFYSDWLWPYCESEGTGEFLHLQKRCQISILNHYILYIVNIQVMPCYHLTWCNWVQSCYYFKIKEYLTFLYY